MSVLELIVRTAGVALLLGSALGLALRRERTATRPLLALVCLGMAAFIAGSAPGFYRAAGPVAAPLVHGLCNATPILAWLLARSWFGSGFTLRSRHVAGCVAYALAMLAADYGRFGVGPLGGAGEAASTLYAAGRAFAAAVVLAALWDTLVRRADDLVEPRRRARLVFFVALAGYVAVLAASELLFGVGGAPRGWVTLGNGVLLAGAAAMLVVLLNDGARDALIASWDVAAAATLPPPPAGPRVARAAAVDGRLDPIARAAVRAMQDDRLYRRDDLTIAVLAQHLGCPEYQLRRAINGSLGHRNFSDFVHGWRLREAADRLRSPDFDDQSILDVALEVGFASIGPFNRAFKARFGTTPSEFRARGAAPAAE